MDDGLLSLKWNNHKSTFFNILKVLRDKNNYSDVTLAVEGKFYSVHKLILSTCSEYFKEIFDSTPCKYPVIVLKDIRYQDLEALLDYMYLGEVNVNQNDLPLLLKSAECLKIKGLAIPDNEAISSNIQSQGKDITESEGNAEPPSKRFKDDARYSIPLPIDSSSLNHPPKLQKEALNPDFNPMAVKMEPDESSFELPPGNTSNNDPVDDTNDTPLSKNTKNDNHVSGDISWNEDENYIDHDTFTEDPTMKDTCAEPDDEDGDVTNGSFNSLSLMQSKESRRCQLCQVTLANANLLRRHVEDHHFHIRKYDCTHCGKKFKRKEHRERHERIHTGEKPFVCQICGSRFTQKEHLKGHVENVHKRHRGLDKDDSEYLSSSSPPSLASPASLASMMQAAVFSPTPYAGLVAPPSPTPYAGLIAPPSPPSILPTTSADEKAVTALYAPVTRKSVDSPGKHVQTITINFN